MEKIALGFERGGFFTEPLPVEVFTKKDFSDERREMTRTGKSARRFASGSSTTRISMA